MRIPIFQVSVFVDGPFSGNPAAVCPLDSWLSGDVMQGIAANNNLSETAFLVPRADGSYDLKWFTPTVEVDLCGHATVAAGYVVLEKLHRELTQAVFHTRSGELRVEQNGSIFALDIPATVPTDLNDAETRRVVREVLGCGPVGLLDAGVPVAVFDEQRIVADLTPDFAGMLSSGLNWLSVTAPAAGAETDFVSRYFAPASGINEDPVTGSAHGWLVPYWSSRLGKTSLTARQLSRRGGRLVCEYSGERVSVAGRVHEFMRGEIRIG